jgi:hypothetical protein
VEVMVVSAGLGALAFGIVVRVRRWLFGAHELGVIQTFSQVTDSETFDMVFAAHGCLAVQGCGRSPR